MRRIAAAIVIVAVLAIGLWLLVGRRGAMAGASDVTYVPGNKCKICHIKIFKAYDETAHAKSFENLKNAGKETNADCLPCHTTGYGQPGGFVDVASTPDLVGTTCQACHGPGSAHIVRGLGKEQRRETIERAPGNACIKCHRSHEAHPDTGM